MPEEKNILEIRNLSKEFRLRSPKLGQKPRVLHALTGVNLTVREGETLGVIGESGCGKSTLGRCVALLHKPTSGQILFEGRDITRLSGRERKEIHRKIQIIFQDSYASLDPRYTCGKAVEEPLIVHRDLAPGAAARHEKALNLMQDVGLDVQHYHRYPHEFSGGQRQRINVARALILSPRIIVCDEPVSALDVSIQAQVLNLFKDLQRRYALTYLFISHDLGVIRHISDRIAIMYLGHVVELCAADDIYTHPLHPYTRALLSSIPTESPFEQKEHVPLEGDVPSPVGEMTGCPFAGRCPIAVDRCRRETPELREIEPGHSAACFLAQTQFPT